jgi:hypothetical protein
MTAWEWGGGAAGLRFGSLNLVCGAIIGGVIRSIQLYSICVVLCLGPPSRHSHVCRGDTKRLSNVNIVVQTLLFQTLCFTLYLGFRL